MVLLIDNYDSFTYNLYQLLGMTYKNVIVKRNDEVNIEYIEKNKPKAIIISPGPGHPNEYKEVIDIIKRFYKEIPILGICLGHQMIALAFDSKIKKLDIPTHAVKDNIEVENDILFKDLNKVITVGRYHSLIIDDKNISSNLKIISKTKDNVIMGVKHKDYNLYGLQFHPESILTKDGLVIINNFLKEISKINTLQKNIQTDIPKIKLKPYIEKVVSNTNLTKEESKQAMDIIMNNEATDSQISSFITALRMKKETIDEITGFVQSMRENKIRINGLEESIDIVGTGGDLSHSFNISSTTSFVVAASGFKVVKHGNRSVSSKSGSADVLEELGVKIITSPNDINNIMKKTNISFLFAPSYHASMKYVFNVRREVGIRTIFNILGPLTNPANNNYILLGTYEKELVDLLSGALLNLGIKRAMVVYGLDGLDEVSISDKTYVNEIKDNKIIKYYLDPIELGFPKYYKDELKGGSSRENAIITYKILNNEIHGAKRDIVVLNAACALYLVGKANTIVEGVQLANNLINNKVGLNKLNEFIKISQEV